MAQRSWRKILLISLIVILSITSTLFLYKNNASAAINPQINFQGKLTNPDGTNVTDGNYSIVFSIYTVSSGGVAVWTETQATTAVDDGIFQVNLGSVTTLPGSVDFNSTSLYLGIKVGADPEMSPRVRLTAAPYAFNADRLGGIAASSFLQLGQATAQTDSSTNSLVFLNKTSTGNLLQLQQAGVDRLVVDNSGLITTASVNSASIVNGSVANADLVNSSVTITAGNGLTTGGSVALGSGVTLDIGAGNGITVNANDITVRALNAADALSATTSSGSGIEILTTGIGLLQGCANGQSLVWNETTDVWACGGFSIAADSLNYTDFADTLALDATTIVNQGAFDYSQTLDGTGDYKIRTSTQDLFTVLNTGAITLGNSAVNQNLLIDNGNGVISIGATGDGNTNLFGTGAGDIATIGSATGSTTINSTNWNINPAGNATLTALNLGAGTIEGAGLTDCDTVNSKLTYDSTSKQFICGHDRGSVIIYKTADESITFNTTPQNDDHLFWNVGAGETWYYYIFATAASLRTPGLRTRMDVPAGSTNCFSGQMDGVNNNQASNATCGAILGMTGTLFRNGTTGVELSGYFTTGGSAGTAQFMFSQNTSSGTAATLRQGTYIVAYKLTGADLAETYNSHDTTIQQGMVVEIDGSNGSLVKKGSNSYSDRQLGIVSTRPGILLGGDGLGNGGNSYPIALSGRVPVKISLENGTPKAGDMLTASSARPGYLMKATKSGYVVAQLLIDAIVEDDATASSIAFIKNGYWQAPLKITKAEIIASNSDTTTQLSNDNETMIDLAESTNEVKNLLKEQANSDNNEPSLQPSITTISELKLNNTEINDLKTKLAAITTDTLQLSTRFDSLNVLKIDSLLSLTEDKSVKIMSGLSINGWLQLNSNQVGNVVIKKGQKTIEYKFTTPAIAGINVQLTPREKINGSYWISKSDNNGFEISLSEAQSKDVQFDYQVILTNNKQNGSIND